MVDFAIPLLRRGAGAFIVNVIGHSYLISLLPLLLTIPLLLTMLSVVLAARHAPAGKGCRPCPSYLCQVGRTTADSSMPVSDRLPVSGRPRRRANCPRARGRGAGADLTEQELGNYADRAVARELNEARADPTERGSGKGLAEHSSSEAGLVEQCCSGSVLV
ncbi:hypothetical protein B296_00007185 [Ensete ventricosum]|uniref:Uncharacterized protein n=1 Tax=Ensete ventricosum TaxID=4639 RepID=A0A427A3F0_ENSVE|nr:hypothetical protein B296_00007185 [Ensete ventricosum]